MGVLNVAAMPAPAPQASKTLRSAAVVETNWPTSEPNAPPGLDNRPLGAERAAGANRGGCRDGLEDRDFGFDAALGSENRLHRLRDAVPLDFRRAILRHKPDNDSADDRNDDHPRAELVIRRAAKMEGPYVVERKIREQSNQVVEKKRNDSGNDAHEPGQQRNVAETEPDGTLGAVVRVAYSSEKCHRNEPLDFLQSSDSSESVKNE
jgi:hypothetical protein